MALAVSEFFAGGALAQAPAWPVKPVKIIVNYPPGGSTDNATRPYAERLSKVLGQPVVIENKSGASGAVGVETGVRSTPDGYTFFATPVAAIAILPHARQMSYDPFKDMVPVTQYADSTLVVAVPGESHGSLNKGLGETGDFATGEVDRFLAALR